MGKLEKILHNKYYLSYFNEDDTSTLTKELVDRNNIGDYVSKIIVNNKIQKHAGIYNLKLKTISISPETIIDKSIKWMNTFPFDVSDIATTKLCNLIILETINHEIRHAIQNKKADNIDNNPANIIIKEGIDFCKHKEELLAVRDRLFYKTFYRNVIVEREASIMALVDLINLDKEIEFISQFEKNQYINPRLIERIKSGYTLNSCPAEKYFKLKFKYKDFKNIISIIKYDYQTALSLGLPIDFETYSEIKNNEEKKILSKILKK